LKGFEVPETNVKTGSPALVEHVHDFTMPTAGSLGNDPPDEWLHVRFVELGMVNNPPLFTSP
jgi:hypothetical protein